MRELLLIVSRTCRASLSRENASSVTPAFRRGLSSLNLDGRSFRLAVVGAGPAGFYAASKLLSLAGTQNVRVDMFEELPVPFGLVRFGVAPDHPEVKNCQHKFEETAEDPRFRFFGNVQVGAGDPSDAQFEPPSPTVQPVPSRNAAKLPLESLRQHYDAVLLAYGAALDRPLHISGETELDNIFSAREFVHFYNGHPYADLPRLDLSRVEHVTIIGQGNVAFDCARMLLTPIDQLAKTDLPEAALAELARSRVKRVDVVGRRGPAQVAGTTKELRELLQLNGVAFEVDSALLQQAQAALEPQKNERAKKRLLALMQEGAKSPGTGDKSWALKFLLSPSAFETDDVFAKSAAALQARPPVKRVEWEVTKLTESADPLTAKAEATGEHVTTSTDLVLKSVGYRSVGISGVPFDEGAGVVCNVNGRVTDESGSPLPGLYAAGWLARGPTGVIATTMFEAYLTAEIIAADAVDGLKTDGPAIDMSAILHSGGRVVSWTDWQRIDEEERRRGRKLGKPREKILAIPEMLSVLDLR